ncbi:MAG: amidase [Acidimicrobiales bacterium]|nr:amidase [Acidimicrobiales bacterium]
MNTGEQNVVERTVAERLDAELAQLGLSVDDEVRAAWVAAVERVSGELGEGIAPRAMPGGPVPATDAEPSVRDALYNPARVTDDSPWVWRADPPLDPTGTGRLDGLRLAVKDLIAVGGQAVRAGSRARREAPVEPVDAAVVAALRAAGAAVVGTTKLHEFAFGVSGINEWDGTAANPAAPGRVPGGSSSGSAAAVALGAADVALGTDTGGSCRIPAACCSVVGYKPSYGAVDTDGVFPLSPSLDHVGWLAVDVATARRVAEVLGVVPMLGEAAPTGMVRSAADAPRVLGVARRAVEDADADTREAFALVESALAATGWQLLDVSWPGGEETFATSTAIMFTEAAYVHRASLPQDPEAYGADVRARLVQGRLYDLPTYLRARERRDRLRARCLQTLSRVTAVVGPTLAVVPPPVAAAADAAVAARLVANTRLANLTGLPAISVPVPGRTLPVGIQIETVADETAFIVAAALEAALRRATQG